MQCASTFNRLRPLIIIKLQYICCAFPHTFIHHGLYLQSKKQKQQQVLIQTIKSQTQMVSNSIYEKKAQQTNLVEKCSKIYKERDAVESAPTDGTAHRW